MQIKNGKGKNDQIFTKKVDSFVHLNNIRGAISNILWVHERFTFPFFFVFVFFFYFVRLITCFTIFIPLPFVDVAVLPLSATPHCSSTSIGGVSFMKLSKWTTFLGLLIYLLIYRNFFSNFDLLLRLKFEKS